MGSSYGLGCSSLFSIPVDIVSRQRHGEKQTETVASASSDDALEDAGVQDVDPETCSRSCINFSNNPRTVEFLHPPKYLKNQHSALCPNGLPAARSRWTLDFSPPFRGQGGCSSNVCLSFGLRSLACAQTATAIFSHPLGS